jgi:hypothetical protein
MSVHSSIMSCKIEETIISTQLEPRGFDHQTAENAEIAEKGGFGGGAQEGRRLGGLCALCG